MITTTMNRIRHFPLTALFLFLALSPASPAQAEDYSAKEIMAEVDSFFGGATADLTKLVRGLTDKFGQPNAFITGSDKGAAIGAGLRYGKGKLKTKAGASRSVFWQSPSIGFDLGGSSSQVMSLVYNLGKADDIYQRYPGVDGGVYFIGGVGATYNQLGKTVLATIRTGTGRRAGASAGYLKFSRDDTWNPF